ncbi:hypothetical protein D3C71_1484850 [compost metagenome]
MACQLRQHAGRDIVGKQGVQPQHQFGACRGTPLGVLWVDGVVLVHRCVPQRPRVGALHFGRFCLLGFARQSSGFFLGFMLCHERLQAGILWIAAQQVAQVDIGQAGIAR